MVSRCGLALRLPGTDAGRLFMCLWAISVCLLGRNVCRVLCPFFNQGGYVAPELQELWALWDPPVSSAGAVGTLGSPRVGHRSRGHSGIPLCRARELWALWPPPPVLDAGAVGTLGPTTVLGAGAMGTLGGPPPCWVREPWALWDPPPQCQARHLQEFSSVLQVVFSLFSIVFLDAQKFLIWMKPNFFIFSFL